MRPSPVTYWLSLVALFASPALGRGGDALESERRPIPAFSRPALHSTVGYDEPGDGSLWARGRNYKASFDARGATYYPLFGRGQPAHYPLALSPSSVVLCGQELAFERSASASRASDRIEIDRGVFVEAYALTPDSMEQSFVFDELPARGELVLSIPVASPLPSSETAAGFEFHGELGKVSYGRALALDAAGRRAEAPSRLVDGAIEIRVDADFVAAAELPLVIDPVILTFSVDGSSNYDNFEPDVAYDDDAELWYFVYEEYATDTDRDVHSMWFDSNGNQVYGTYLNLDTASWNSPRVANLGSASKFLCVASVTVFGLDMVGGRLAPAGGGEPGPVLSIGGPELGDKISADVGGDPNPDHSYFCVVYERVVSATSHEIEARLVDGTGDVLDSTLLISGGSIALDGVPSISKSAGGNRWLIAWERTAGDTTHIWARSVRYDGALYGSTQITSGFVVDSNVSVSTHMDGFVRFALAFERAFGSTTHIMLAAIKDLTVLHLTDLDDLEQNPSYMDRSSPSIDCDGQHFLVSYAEAISANLWNVYASELYLADDHFGVHESRVPIGVTTEIESAPAVAAAEGSGGPAQLYALAWDRRVTAGDHDVEGAVFSGGQGGSAIPYCLPGTTLHDCPCGNGGFGRGCPNSSAPNGSLLSTSGTPSTAADSFVLSGSQLKPNAPCVLIQGSQPITDVVFGDGLSCTGGTVLRLAVSTTTPTGHVLYPSTGDPSISEAGLVPPQGGTFIYQFWYRDPAIFCTPAGFNLTAACLVSWAP